MKTKEARLAYLNPPEIRIVDCGYVSLDTHWRCQGCQSPFSCFYLVESGSGILIENGQQTVMKPGHAYLIPTGAVYDYRCDDSLVKLFFHVNILGADGLDMLQGLEGIHSCRMHPGELEALVQLYQKSSVADALAMRHRILDVLSRILYTFPASAMRQKEYSPLVQRVMDYIQSNLSNSLSMQQLAQEQYIAQVTLRKHFKQETGKTPRQYIEDLLFFRAELMLRMTSLTVKEISSTLGFCDQFYFSRRFTKRFHISPQAYRLLAQKSLVDKS